MSLICVGVFVSVKRTPESVNLKVFIFYFSSIWIDLPSEYYNCTN